MIDGARTGWCILRTSGRRTLPLALFLNDAGIEAWSPARVIRRPAPGQRRRLVMGQRRVLIDVRVAVLPSFVFASADRLADIARLASVPQNEFTIFQFGGSVPVVSDASVTGLRAAEEDYAAQHQALCDAETRAKAQQDRAEMLRTDRARQKALRKVSKPLVSGDAVVVNDMPALSGVIGRVIQGNGTSALIDFGGSLTMTVDAWRLLPVTLREGAALQGTAA
ncbi:MAG: hypothetical protein JWQ03_3072 [Variovorax sp.]|nr:hypothetical protein [Variovorax sp.]